MRDKSPLTFTSVLPWVYGEFCEYKLWLRQMIIHCWWAGPSGVLLHQRQCQSLQHKRSPNATQDVTEMPLRFISHAGKPVLSRSYCVLYPLYCRHHRWLWTSVTVCFCTGQGMLKSNLGMFIFTVYSLFLCSCADTTALFYAPLWVQHVWNWFNYWSSAAVFAWVESRDRILWLQIRRLSFFLWKFHSEPGYQRVTLMHFVSFVANHREISAELLVFEASCKRRKT